MRVRQGWGTAGDKELYHRCYDRQMGHYESKSWTDSADSRDMSLIVLKRATAQFQEDGRHISFAARPSTCASDISQYRNDFEVT